MLKKIKKIFCLVLCVSILFPIIPMNAKSLEELENMVVVEEIISLRDEYTKHFRNEDGTITAASYPSSIHYLDEEGNWQDIDNSLIENNSDVSKNSNSNNKNNENKNVNSEYLKLKNNPNIGVLFAKKSNHEELIKVNIKGYELSWGIENIEKSQGKVITEKSNDKFNLTNVSSGVIYKNVLQNVDLVYYISSSNLKEEFHINKKSDVTSFIYNVKTDLKAEKTDHDLIIFRDELGNDIMTFQNPYMYDSAEQSGITFNTEITLEETNDGYKINYQLDEEWLNSEDRVYPIIVDPYITNSATQTNILDTYVHVGDAASHNHVNADRLYIGKRETISRAFMNWGSLPTINGTITSSAIDFNYFKGTSTWGGINIYSVNSSWNSYTITWDNHHNLGYNLLHQNVGPTLRNGYQNFFLDVTGLVQGWYYNNSNGSNNRNGFMVGYTNESYNDYNAIVSSDGSSGSSYWPTLKIWYEESVPTGTYEGLGWAYPTPGFNTITQGVTSSHPAIDIGGVNISGTPVYAVADGIIEIKINNHISAGNWLILKTDNVDYQNGNNFRVGYMHLDSIVSGINQGTRVSKNQIIGYVGDSGNADGKHLHFEIYSPASLGAYYSASSYSGFVRDPRDFYSNI